MTEVIICNDHKKSNTAVTLYFIISFHFILNKFPFIWTKMWTCILIYMFSKQPVSNQHFSQNTVTINNYHFNKYLSSLTKVNIYNDYFVEWFSLWIVRIIETNELKDFLIFYSYYFFIKYNKSIMLKCFCCFHPEQTVQ